MLKGEGSENAQIMLVGEAPGAQEIRDNRPFAGAAGRTLRQSLASAGIPPGSTFITNTCQHHPPKNNIEAFVKIRKPRDNFSDNLSVQLNDKVASGIRQLYLDIARIKPRVIIPLGNIALWALTGKMKILKRAGSILSVTMDILRVQALSSVMDEPLIDAISQAQSITVIPNVHPSFVNRKFEYAGYFIHLLKRAAAEAANPRGAAETEPIINPSNLDLRSLTKTLLAAPQMAFDIEVVGGDRLFCVGFGCDPSWALTLTPDTPDRLNTIRKLLASPVPKITQNGIFDRTWLERFAGITVAGPQHDTIILQALAYPDYPKGLDFIGSFYTRFPYHKDEGKNWNPREAVDIQRFLEYNAKDVAVTLAAFQSMQKDELADHRTTYQRIQVQSPAYESMMHHGIRVDLARLAELRDTYMTDAIELQQALDQHVGKTLASLIKHFKEKNNTKNVARLTSFLHDVVTRAGTLEGGLNVNSSKQLCFWLYEVLGLKPKKNKKTKRLTADETALKELFAETHDPTLLTIYKIREKRKAISSYLTLKTQPNGTCFFSYQPVKAKTGRSACGQTILGEGNNKQTIPHTLRSIYIPDRSGNEFAYLDLAQAEARIVAYQAGIERMINAFETNQDLHTLTASLILDIPLDQVEDYPHRYLGKRCNHAFNYEMGPYKFAQIVNNDATETGISVTRSEAKKLRAAHIKTYPELGFYWDEIRQMLRKNRTIINPLGRKRVFLGRFSDALYREAFSHFAQSTVADLLRTGMVAVHDHLERIPNARITLEVHDALLIQYPRKLRVDIIPRVLELMTIPFAIKGKEITIPVDAKVGPTWADEDLVPYAA